MNAYQSSAAELLATGASAYASHAAALLLEDAALARRYEPDGFRRWKNHLTAVIRELAVAVDLQAPALFAASVEWSRQSFDVRQVPQEDLRASLENLRLALRQELPASARDEVDATFAHGLTALDSELPSLPQLDASHDEGRLAVTYLEACLVGQTRRAESLVLEAAERVPVEKIYVDVLVPAQREVGRLWHAGEIGVHEEHVVTVTTERLLALLGHLHARQPQRDKTVVGGSIQDNNHDIGVRVVTEFFALDGWNAIFLGSGMPASDLARAARDFHADLVILSIALIAQLANLRPAIAALREAAPAAKVLLGGLALSAAPDVWRTIGADGYAAHPREAVEVGSTLVGIDRPSGDEAAN